MTRRCTALALFVVAAALCAPGAGSAQQRLRLPADERLSPGPLLAGSQVVLASRELRPELRLVPLAGGSVTRVPVPEPPAGSTLRVADVSAGRVLLATDPFAADGGTLAVGPPAGPLVDPAVCGEAATAVGTLDGDRIAYAASPRPDASCSTGADPATTPAVVVRDLTTGARLAEIPIASAADVNRLRLAGDHLALQLVESLGGHRRAGPLRVLTLAGVPVTELPPRAVKTFELGTDGTVVGHGGSPTADATPCVGVVTRARIYRPRDPVGRPIGGSVCEGSALRLNGTRLVYGARGAGGTTAVVERDVATDTKRTLVDSLAGALVDADEATLLVTSTRCVGIATLALDAVAPARPGGSRTCPIRIRAPRAVTRRQGTPIPVTVSCRAGCFARIELRVGGRSVERQLRLPPGRATTVRTVLRLPRVGGATVIRLRVLRYADGLELRELTRRIRFR